MQKEENTITIKLSKKKLFLLIIACIAFITTCVWLWIIADSQNRFTPIFVKLVSIVGVLFFGIILPFLILKLFDNKPGLIINSTGIQDNSSAMGMKFIQWNEIIKIDIAQVQTTRFILIFITNPEEIIEKGNSIQKKLMRMNHKTYGTPISISSNSLKCNFDELLTIISQKLKENSY